MEALKFCLFLLFVLFSSAASKVIHVNKSVASRTVKSDDPFRDTVPKKLASTSGSVQPPCTPQLTTIQPHPVSSATTVEYAANGSCELDLKYVNENLDKDWAKQMMDASTNVHFEKLRWRTYWPGNLDYCRTVTAPSETDADTIRFRGKYCYVGRSAKIINDQTLYLLTDACFPDSCSSDDFKAAYEHDLLKPWLAVTGVSLNWTMISTSCRDIRKPFSAGAIVMICLLLTLVIFVIAGTTITLIERYTTRYSPMVTEMTNSGDGLSLDAGRFRPTTEQTSLLDRGENQCVNRIVRFLKCFCAMTNLSKIFNLKRVKEREPLLCLHGIRFVAMTWVILIHTYNNTFTMVTKDEFRKTMYMMNDWAFQIIIQASFAVDTFFFLSGFLVTFIFLREANANDGRISWLYFYIHRYWRLTPTYAIVLGIHVALIPSLYVPFFVKMDPEICKWWVNLLYLNNVIAVGKTCMSWTWYLANDMQFYIISPVFLYPLWRWPKFGVAIIVTMLFGSCLVCGLLTYEYDLIPGYTQLSETTNFTQFVPRSTEYFITLYNKPYARIQPYLVGALMAYILYQQIDKKIILTKWTLLIGWLSAIIIALVDVYGVHGTNPGIIGRSLYNAFTHLAFSVSLAWVVFICLTGYGGIVNMFLSHDVFLPLSRLTYCAYLVHPVYMLMYYDVLRTPFYMNHLTLVTVFFAFFFLAYCLGLVASLLIESPMLALEKLMLRRKEEEKMTP